MVGGKFSQFRLRKIVFVGKQKFVLLGKKGFKLRREKIHFVEYFNLNVKPCGVLENLFAFAL